MWGFFAFRLMPVCIVQLSAVVAFLTVGFQAYKTARANPVEALKDE